MSADRERGRPGAPETGGRASEPSAAPGVGGFRILLAAGALIFLMIGVWGLFFSGALHAALGPQVGRNVAGYLGLARLFGALSVSIGIGYVIASLHPLRHRGLLAVLFAVPLLLALSAIVAAAKSEISPAKGAVFAAVALAYVLLYFRLYPKPAVGEGQESSGKQDGGTPPSGGGSSGGGSSGGGSSGGGRPGGGQPPSGGSTR